MSTLSIDGAHGEGGGQILRTSLALSMITGRPIAIRNIRAGRAKPGLRRQHLACVEAARQVCNGVVRGAEIGSKYLELVPGEIGDADLTIDIGTAGSTTLVVQTVVVPAIAAGRTLRLAVRGGTHNPMAPPFEFLARVFLPQLRAMGADVVIALDRHGFVSSGDVERGEPTRGQLMLRVQPGPLRPHELLDASPITSRHATAIVGRLPTHVGQRELGIVQEQLGWAPRECELRDVSSEAGPGNALLLEVERSHVREIVTGFGEKGTRAELVARRACDEMAAYLAANVPVGEHLADQLLLPLAVAGGGAFRSTPLSRHATTNIDVIGLFLDVPIRVESDGTSAIVSVG